MEILTISGFVLALLFAFLLTKDRLKLQKYKEILKGLFKASLTYINANDASVIVKDVKNKLVFSTRKIHFPEIENVNHEKIYTLEISPENEIKVKGGTFSPLDIIEKFCVYQSDNPQTGFVKIDEKLYFFLSKKICFKNDYYYLYLYQPENLLSLEKIFETLENVKGISFAKYKNELIIFRSDEDFKALKDTIKVKC